MVSLDQLALLKGSAADKKIAGFRVGDTVRVHVKIKEGDKERVQMFEGVVIARKRGRLNPSFTVRKVASGVGVERIFPLNSPSVQKVDLLNRGKVRRNRLYYLRKRTGKAARIEEQRSE